MYLKLGKYLKDKDNDLIIGGRDTCQGIYSVHSILVYNMLSNKGDSGGPLWVEEKGRGIQHDFKNKTKYL